MLQVPKGVSPENKRVRVGFEAEIYEYYFNSFKVYVNDDEGCVCL